jgi:hypothetical protein
LDGFLPKSTDGSLFRRVLSVANGTAQVEMTFETEGWIGDVHYTTLGTLVSIIRPDGTLYGDLQVGLRTDNNDTGVYRRIAGGKLGVKTGEGFYTYPKSETA